MKKNEKGTLHKNNSMVISLNEQKALVTHHQWKLQPCHFPDVP